MKIANLYDEYLKTPLKEGDFITYRNYKGELKKITGRVFSLQLATKVAILGGISYHEASSKLLEKAINKDVLSINVAESTIWKGYNDALNEIEQNGKLIEGKRSKKVSRFQEIGILTF